MADSIRKRRLSTDSDNGYRPVGEGVARQRRATRHKEVCKRNVSLMRRDAALGKRCTTWAVLAIRTTLLTVVGVWEELLVLRGWIGGLLVEEVRTTVEPRSHPANTIPTVAYGHGKDDDDRIAMTLGQLRGKIFRSLRRRSSRGQ